MVRIHSVVRDTRLRKRGETDEKSAKDSKERPQPENLPSCLPAQLHFAARKLTENSLLGCQDQAKPKVPQNFMGIFLPRELR